MSTINPLEELIKFIKDAEDRAIGGSILLSEKKLYVIDSFKQIFPDFYNEHIDFVDLLIDSYILILNNPEVLLTTKKYCCCN